MRWILRRDSGKNLGRFQQMLYPAAKCRPEQARDLVVSLRMTSVREWEGSGPFSELQSSLWNQPELFALPAGIV